MTKESNWVVVPSGKQGFASMTPEKRKEIAILGGKAVPAEKRAFSTKKGLAAKAGARNRVPAISSFTRIRSVMRAIMAAPRPTR